MPRSAWRTSPGLSRYAPVKLPGVTESSDSNSVRNTAAIDGNKSSRGSRCGRDVAQRLPFLSPSPSTSAQRQFEPRLDLSPLGDGRALAKEGTRGVRGEEDVDISNDSKSQISGRE